MSMLLIFPSLVNILCLLKRKENKTKENEGCESWGVVRIWFFSMGSRNRKGVVDFLKTFKFLINL